MGRIYGAVLEFEARLKGDNREMSAGTSGGFILLVLPHTTGPHKSFHPHATSGQHQLKCSLKERPCLLDIIDEVGERDR